MANNITITVKTLAGDLLTFEFTRDHARANRLEEQIYERLPEIPFGCICLMREGEDEPVKGRERLIHGETLHLLVLPDNVRVEVLRDTPSRVWDNDSVLQVDRTFVIYYDIRANDLLRSMCLIHHASRGWALHETFTFRYELNQNTPWSRTELMHPTEQTSWHASPIDCLLSATRRFPTDPRLMAEIEDAIRVL